MRKHNANNDSNIDWREKLHRIIYEADTPAGKLFDVVLLILILFSILIIMLETVPSIDSKYHHIFNLIEWIITILFSIEYIARIISIKRTSAYIFSFYGIIDFISTVPMYISLFFIDVHNLMAIRSLRLLRVFRILKLNRFIGESESLMKAMKASRHKISVFLMAVVTLVIIMGTLMYLIEYNQDSGFDSIPKSVYWAIVTLTTVGYGDVAPVTPFGQFIASIIMILGYGIIAVPTGIVGAEISKNRVVHTSTQSCQNCHATDHNDDAIYCYKCGEKLN
ncbi:MAG: ion transporter [Saprospiraceae bacterium]